MFQNSCCNANCFSNDPNAKEKFRTAEEENYRLKSKIEETNDLLKTFLNEDQIASLDARVKWTTETISKALKFRFALNVHGYDYLRRTNYPLPSYCTINRRVREFKIDFSIFKDILQALKFKVETMPISQQYCVLSIDEIEINQGLSWDKTKQKLYGYVTLGDRVDHLGNHILIVVCSGIKQNWKQIIAAHITDNLVDGNTIKNFLDECIRLVEETGLQVIALSSNMKTNFQSVWNEYNCYVNNDGTRKNAFQSNNRNIFIVPEVYNIVKKLKAVTLTSTLCLPEEFLKCEGLPIADVSGKYVLDLWNAEIDANNEIFTLSHLSKDDLYQDDFEKMNIESVERFFSLRTATGLELGVQLKVLPEAALVTAKFIRIIGRWFNITASEKRKCIISRNKNRNYEFLHKIIDLFQNTRIGKEWKPLNSAVIMSTLSVCDITNFLLENGFESVPACRFTECCCENIFSEIRKRAGTKPNALGCLQALRTITLSQFTSELKKNSYCGENSDFLPNVIDKDSEMNSNNCFESVSNFLNDENIFFETGFEECTSFGKNNAALSNYSLNTFRIDNEMVLQFFINTRNIKTLCGIGDNIVKATLNTCCELCNNFLNNISNDEIIFNSDDDSNSNGTFYSNFLNMGGLKYPCQQLIELIINCEMYFQKFKRYILYNPKDILIYKLYNELNIYFPACCNIKQKIIEHFFKIRLFIVVLSKRAKRQRNNRLYGSVSVKKRK